MTQRSSGWSRVWAALPLLLAATSAHAQSAPGVVLPLLALIGLAGGMLMGAVAGWRGQPHTALWPGFGIHLGLLSLAASTRAGSLEVVPLTLVLGAAAGIVPFTLAWFALRWGVGAVRHHTHTRRR